MVRLFLKLVIWVTVARWMYAETQIVAPRAVPYINAAMQHIDIPTHDKWSGSSVGQYLKQQLPDAGSVRQQLTANIELPIKHSAGVLAQASDALNMDAGRGGFEKF